MSKSLSILHVSPGGGENLINSLCLIEVKHGQTVECESLTSSRNLYIIWFRSHCMDDLKENQQKEP